MINSNIVTDILKIIFADIRRTVKQSTLKNLFLQFFLIALIFVFNVIFYSKYHTHSAETYNNLVTYNEKCNY